MADNVDITPGTGKTIATDEVTDGTLGTVQVQYVKIMDGTLNGTTKAAVDGSGVAVKPSAQEIHLGEIGGNSSLISPTVTVSTTPAYTAGDMVGGKLTLTAALRVSNGASVLNSLLIIDTSNQKAALDVYIFDSDPTNGTYTDNAAVVFGTDTAKLIARVPVAVQDYVTNNSIAVAHVKNIGAVLRGANGNTNLYAVIVTSSTPTYATTTAIVARFGFLND